MFFFLFVLFLVCFTESIKHHFVKLFFKCNFFFFYQIVADGAFSVKTVHKNLTRKKIKALKSSGLGLGLCMFV